MTEDDMKFIKYVIGAFNPGTSWEGGGGLKERIYRGDFCPCAQCVRLWESIRRVNQSWDMTTLCPPRHPRWGPLFKH